MIASDAPRLILASQSPRRADLLREAGLDPIIAPSHTDELTSHSGSPTELAAINAREKCRAVAARFPADVVLAADTIVVFEGEVFGKPGDRSEAEAMLARLVGHTHTVVTAIHILCREAATEHDLSVATEVTFRRLDAAQISAYLDSIDPLDKAGAYAAQEDEGRLIAETVGSFSNVIGLPIDETLAVLRSEFPQLFSDSLVP